VIVFLYHKYNAYKNTVADRNAMKIFIYQDYLHNNGALYKAFAMRYSHTNVRFVDADDIIADGVLNEYPDIFVMPGGESRYVANKLKGQGNRHIRAYIENGGIYLGICAGAYYACAQTEWRQERDEVALAVENELALCPLTAKGPIAALPCFSMGEEIPVQITGIESDGQRHDVLYWGGPLFYDVDDNIEILARYSDIPDKPPAIIAGRFGKGRYILSSPHIEYTSETFNLSRFDVPRNARAHLNTVDGARLDEQLFEKLCGYWEV
jgi:glutamine amidotransferase-like uncharacterized protein